MRARTGLEKGDGGTMRTGLSACQDIHECCLAGSRGAHQGGEDGGAEGSRAVIQQAQPFLVALLHDLGPHLFRVCRVQTLSCHISVVSRLLVCQGLFSTRQVSQKMQHVPQKVTTCTTSSTATTKNSSTNWSMCTIFPVIQAKLHFTPSAP